MLKQMNVARVTLIALTPSTYRYAASCIWPHRCVGVVGKSIHIWENVLAMAAVSTVNVEIDEKWYRILSFFF